MTHVPQPTIYDVAAEAGVSPSTVSRTISRPDQVSFATAEKVRAAATKLGYGAHLNTRSHRLSPTRASGNLGLVVADLRNPFFLDILRGAEHAAIPQTMIITTVNTNESPVRARQAVDHLIPHVDGLLLSSARLADQELRRIARTVPTVILNRPVSGVPSVMVDNYDGAVKAALHLREQGCESITYLTGPTTSFADAIRWRGLLDAARGKLSETEAPPLTRGTSLASAEASETDRFAVRRIRVASPTQAGGNAAFSQWRRDPTDGVVCFNDLLAIGFIQQAMAHGFSVPQDVAVMGFDDTEIAELCSPSLTTVGGPLRSVGRVATASLIALLRGLRKPPTKPRLLPVQVVVRESSLRRPTH